MPYSQYHERSSIGVLANVADHQERQYRQYIKQNETMGTGIAMRLARGEPFEELLGKDVAEEYREQLKGLASENVEKERQLKAYATAIRVVIENASQNQNNQTNEDTKDANTTHEFKDQMETEYAKALESIKKSSLLITQEPSYVKLCQQLGEDDDEDDELAVVNPSSGDSLAKIRCPLTMAIMEDPVRSKICKHSFDRNAIFQHLRISRECPVPGCLNNRMTTAELEDDPETKMRVRRYKKRLSASKRAQAQSAIDMGEDDFDDDDEVQF
jgi:hypothetical protein